MRVFPPFLLDVENECLWRREATVDDVRVRLTPKAFAVLNYLVERAGHLVSQDELLNALWPDTFVQPEVLKSHIQDIRGALGDSARNSRFIETRPKRGYQFIAHVREMTIEAQRNPVPRDDAPVEQSRHKFVGRESQLTQLHESLRNCMRAQRQVLFITGEAGIGKTTLVDEFLRTACANFSKLKVLRGQCVEGYGGTEAYYPVLEALGQLCAGSNGGGIVEVLTTHAPTWLVQLPALVKSEQREALHREIIGATRERMLREICEALDILTLEEPAVLVFEDLHWADPSTVDLISAIARRRTARKLFLIGTYRPVDLSLSQHPLKAVKQDLLVRQLCRVTALEPLLETEVLEYIAHESGGLAISADLAGLIHRDSDGNPLFMVAVLDHMRQCQLVLEEEGVWKMSNPSEIEQLAPDTLRGMIEFHIERLSEDEVRVLEVGSLLLKSSFSASVSAAMTDMELEDLEKVCERLVKQHQLIRPAESTDSPGSPAPGYEFSHVLYKRVLRGRIAPPRRKRLHQRLAVTIESALQQPVEMEATELAFQFEEGGDWLSATRYLRMVADTAGRRYEPRQAAAILEHALELARRLPEPERTQVEIELLEKLGEIYVSCYDERAIHTYETMIHLASQAGLLDVEVRAIFAMAAPMARKGTESYFSCVNRILERSAAQEGSARHHTLRLVSLLRAVAGQFATDDLECLTFYRSLRQTADRLPAPWDYTHWMYFHNLGSRYRDALDCITEGLTALARDTEQNPFINSRYMLYQDLLPRVYLSLGEWGAALQQVMNGTSMLLKNNQSDMAKIMGIPKAWVCLHAGDFRGAAAICDEAFSVKMTGSFTRALRIMRMLAGCAAVGLCDFRKAFDYFAATQEEVNRQPLIGDWITDMPLQWGLTELWLAVGDLAQAHKAAEKFRSCTLSTGERTWQAMAYNSSARLAIAAGHFDQARDFLGKACEVMDGFEVPLAKWRVHATGWELEALQHNPAPAEHHRKLSQAVVMKLANSLPVDEPIRHTFLSSQIVRAVLEGRGSTLPTPGASFTGL